MVTSFNAQRWMQGCYQADSKPACSSRLVADHATVIVLNHATRVRRTACYFKHHHHHHYFNEQHQFQQKCKLEQLLTKHCILNLKVLQ